MRGFLIALLIGFGPAVLAHDDWSTGCLQTVMDYAFFRDRPDADGVAALFTDDAVFRFGGDEWRGAEAIRARIAAGVDGPVFRHVMSTIRIERSGANTARGVSYVTVYRAPAGPLPRTVSGFAAIGEYHDAFVRDGERCLIRERTFVRVLNPAAPETEE